MTITKKNICKDLSKKLGISSKNSASFLESFLEIIKIESQQKYVKFSGFGSFFYKKTPQRLGRNPKTKESCIILPGNRLVFKVANKIKEELN